MTDRLVLRMALVLPVLVTVGAVAWGRLADWLTPVGMVLGVVVWAGAYAVMYRHLTLPADDEDQHKRPVKVPRQRDLNRSWVQHIRREGATHAVVWFAAEEFDEPETITVGIREVLAVLAKHTKDVHLDAVGTIGGDYATTFLSEWTTTEAAV